MEREANSFNASALERFNLPREASDNILVSFKTLHSAISFAEGRFANKVKEVFP